ncbi:hypothetical protein HK101_004475 [Irineochytrium annulatum]|nr:hypothetical protein HK101_004475 [Irineochytrium annulatum]
MNSQSPPTHALFEILVGVSSPSRNKLADPFFGNELGGDDGIAEFMKSLGTESDNGGGIGSADGVRPCSEELGWPAGEAVFGPGEMTGMEDGMLGFPSLTKISTAVKVGAAITHSMDDDVCSDDEDESEDEHGANDDRVDSDEYYSVHDDDDDVGDDKSPGSPVVVEIPRSLTVTPSSPALTFVSCTANAQPSPTAPSQSQRAPSSSSSGTGSPATTESSPPTAFTPLTYATANSPADPGLVMSPTIPMWKMVAKMMCGEIEGDRGGAVTALVGDNDRITNKVDGVLRRVRLMEDEEEHMKEEDDAASKGKEFGMEVQVEETQKSDPNSKNVDDACDFGGLLPEPQDAITERQSSQQPEDAMRDFLSPQSANDFGTLLLPLPHATATLLLPYATTEPYVVASAQLWAPNASATIPPFCSWAAPPSFLVAPGGVMFPTLPPYGTVDMSAISPTSSSAANGFSGGKKHKRVRPDDVPKSRQKTQCSLCGLWFSRSDAVLRHIRKGQCNGATGEPSGGAVRGGGEEKGGQARKRKRMRLEIQSDSEEGEDVGMGSDLNDDSDADDDDDEPARKSSRVAAAVKRRRKPNGRREKKRYMKVYEDVPAERGIK